MICGWNINAFFYDVANSRLSHDIDKIIFNFLKKNNKTKNTSVLDLCAGTGSVSFKSLILGAKHVVAVDDSKYMITRMKHKKQLDFFNGRFKIIKLNVLKKDLSKYFNEKFDIIYLKRALYFSDNENKDILKQCYKLLNKNGLIIIVNPEKNLIRYVKGRKILFALPHFLRRLWAWIGLLTRTIKYNVYTYEKFDVLCEEACPRGKLITLNAPLPAYYIRIIKKE